MTPTRDRTVSLRLPAELLDRFDAKVKARGLTRTQAIQRLIEANLDKIRREETR